MREKVVDIQRRCFKQCIQKYRERMFQKKNIFNLTVIDGYVTVTSSKKNKKNLTFFIKLLLGSFLDLKVEDMV
jgi:hypothetical protein